MKPLRSVSPGQSLSAIAKAAHVSAAEINRVIDAWAKSVIDDKLRKYSFGARDRIDKWIRDNPGLWDKLQPLSVSHRRLQVRDNASPCRSTASTAMYENTIITTGPSACVSLESRRLSAAMIVFIFDLYRLPGMPSVHMSLSRKTASVP